MTLLTLPSGVRLITYAITIVLLIAVGVLVSRWRRQTEIRALKQQHRCKEPAKYPHTDRVMGSDMIRLRAEAMKDGRFLTLYDEQFARYGKTFEEIWRGKPLINTIEPANIQQVAALGFEDYAKDLERLQAMAPFMGPSIFSNGPIWKVARTMVKPIFSRAELSDIDHLASFTDRFMELLPSDGSVVDVQPLLNRLFFDVSMDFIFGRSLDSLQPECSTECTEFLNAFDDAQKGITRRREAGFMDFRLHRTSVDKDWKEAYSKVHRFVDVQVARALRETTEEVKPPSDGPAERRRYVLLDEMAKQVRDPVALRYHVLGVFNPARDATSVAVGNSLFMLARHPEYWAKLRQVSLDLGDKPLTFEKLKSLVEFRYVVQETFRLIGPAARVWRVAVRDTVLPVGGGPDQMSPVFVPKGTPVVLGTWAVNHHPDIWGDDCREFKPERWIGRRPIWEFVPFFGGPRMCPAQQQIYTHTIYLLIRLTRRFARMQNCDPVLEYVQKFKMGFQSGNGVKVALKNS